MASKSKNTKTASKPKATSKAPPKPVVAKVAKAPKVAAGPQKARHPHKRVIENHTSKESLAKSLASVIARGDEDTDALEGRLKRASNQQLLRLSRVTATVTKKYGSRDKMIAAIGTAQNKSKDKDFLTKLESYSLPQLLDLAAAAERAARA
ncbi:MAG: hypothetical protein H0V17_04485 [Deltaproteobacteria bacterium]|nr:hypothetical protein [Deltaproteobacteria bacterium]